MTAQGKSRHFTVDARILLSLGRESIKDPSTAVVELVKNSYDADATTVEVEILSEGLDSDLIRIADDGCGMSSTDIDDAWLRIGYSSKRARRMSPGGRRETGEKGIGRLSADRLGGLLEIQSVRQGEDAVGIRVNWGDFEAENSDVSKVAIQNILAVKPDLPAQAKSKTGTELLIKNLRQIWSDEDVQALEHELETLVPPNEGGPKFRIFLRTRRDQPFRLVRSALEAAAELEFIGKIDSKGRLSYSISTRPLAGSRARHTIKHGKVGWEQLSPSMGSRPFPIGPIEIELRFFPRKPADIDASLTLSQLREYLNAQAGVRIYRDGIRVKPYGDPKHSEGDWLGLSERKSRNPAGAARKDFRISANQLLGTVRIGRDKNPTLADSAAREGLIHGGSFAALKATVFACVQLLEGAYHERFVEKKEEAAQEQRPDDYVRIIRENLSTLRKNLNAIQKAPEEARPQIVKEAIGCVQQVSEGFERVNRHSNEMASQTSTYRGLATVGIASAVFGHETETALNETLASSNAALRMLTKRTPDIAASVQELNKAIESIAKVQVWGQFALTRVKREKRRRHRFNLSALFEDILEEMKPVFGASTIDLTWSVRPKLEIKAIPMDLEAVLLNLLTNAYHAVQKKTRNRCVRVVMASDARARPRVLVLSVADSGSGIAKEHLSRIWEPLFSARTDDSGRPTGTGLGLTIVKSIVSESGGVVTVIPKSSFGGAAFEVTLPVES